MPSPRTVIGAVTTLGIAGLLGIAAVGLVNSRPDPARQLVARIPKFDPDFARHLAADDDSSFAEFCRRVGWSEFQRHSRLLSQRDLGTAEAYRRSEAGKLLHLRRMHRALADAFGLERQARNNLELLAAPSEFRYRRELQLERIQAAAALPPADREATLLELLRTCDDPTERCQMNALAGLALLHTETGDSRRLLKYQRAAVEVALRHGYQPISSQLLGGLGEILSHQGHVDSMSYYWQMGLDLAYKHRITDQAARLHVFFGNHYRKQGRWALANEHMAAARRLGRDPSARGDGFRTMLESLEFPAWLGCWDLVARELRVAGAELREAQAAGSPVTRSMEPLLLEFRAMVEAGRGNVRKADRLFAQADEGYARMGGRIPRRGRLRARWSRALLDAGWTASAIRVSRQGLEYCRTFNILEMAPANALVLARALMAFGDHERCGPALEDFRDAAAGRRDVGARDWIEFDALQARWHAAGGDRDGMLRALRAGLERLETTVLGMEPGPESYLFLSGRNDLRDFLHELVADAPEVGYRIERRWRRATALLGSRRTTGDLVACADLVEEHLEQAPAARPAAAPGPQPADSAIHIVYYVGEQVLRWTVSPHGVRRDVIRIPRRDLEAKVLELVALVAMDPGGPDRPIGARLEAELRSTGQLVLPREITDAPGSSRPRTVQILTDGVLARLPFEALSLSGARYVPVLDRWDVVYVRGLAGASPPTSGHPGVIVADPAVSGRQDRLRGGVPRLRFGLDEARQLAALEPSALTLTGARATKRALTRAWEHADYLFFATHVLEDEDTPYSSFIPLAPDSGTAGVEDERVEIADVLEADLERCGLVVLSGCSSGVPQHFAGPGGPDLAGAFLDAGAQAAIRTAWPVRDDYAAALMREFIRLWKGDDLPAMQALNRARRGWLRGPNGYRHPVTWAAYALDVAQAPGGPAMALEASNHDPAAGARPGIGPGASRPATPRR